MSKTAFIFPGQGAQYVGMGKDFYEAFEEARQVFACAERVSGLPIRELCFEENEKLNITEYTQIAMFTTEAAILACAKAKGLSADVCAGLSLGEYGAILESQAMSLEDLMHVIRKRGIYMQNAYPEGGAMTAVLGMDAEQIEKICEETEGIVSIANYNCPGQIVITGEADAVNRASERLKEAGAKRCVPLKVSGPFHSALLEEAGKQLGAELQGRTIQNPQIHYVSNVTAKYVTDAGEIKGLCEKQVSMSVRWQQCVEAMLADGVDRFLEIGPGKTLSGFMKKISPNTKVWNIQTVADLEQVLTELGEEKC